MPPRRTSCELLTTAVNLLRVGLVLICLSCAPTTLIAETLTWIGAGTGELNSIDPSDPSTAWSEPSNWGDNRANEIPQLDTAGQGTTALLTFTNGGRVYANELTAERVVIDNQYAAPSWEGQLVLGPDGPMQIGNELSLSGGATVVQQGGTLEMLAEDSAVQLTDGSQFRVENGSFHSTGSLSLSGASTFEIVDSVATFDTIRVGNRESSICSRDGSILQVRRLEYTTGPSPWSCLSGRLEAQEIAIEDGQIGEITSATSLPTLAPTDFVNGRETAVLRIDGNARFWGGVDWQVLGPEPGTGYDQVAATGSLMISGWLRLRTTPLRDLGPGESIYLPQSGDTFDLVTSETEFQLTEIAIDFPRFAYGTPYTVAYSAHPGLQMIATQDFHIAAGDLDGDEQLDVDDVDHLARAIRTHNNIEFYDLNEDGFMDQHDLRIWVHQLKETWLGDADLNGRFDSSDLVQVFAAGRYESEQPATWGSGDWNADGEFTSSDLVVALQDGGFERPTVNASIVPEPSTIWSAALGLLGLLSLIDTRCQVRRKTRCEPISE